MCLFIKTASYDFTYFFFRKFYAVMETGERWGRRGWAYAWLGQAPGWCLGSLPRPWRKPRLMKVAYCVSRLIERDQTKCQSEQVQDRSLQQRAVVALPKRHLGAGVGTSEPPAIPQPLVFAGLLLPCISCPVPLSSGSWLYSWVVIKENPILEVKNRSEMRRWSVGFNMDTHVIVTSSAGRINRLMLSCT